MFSELAFPIHGVSLSFISNSFINHFGGRSAFAGLTTKEVSDKYILAYTASTMTSVCDVLLEMDSPCVGVSKAFISHAWRYEFLHVVDAVIEHFVDTPDIIIWFDIFSNNQHKVDDFDYHWLTSTFRNAIKTIGCTVMVFAPWADPIPLTRAWCLFELWCTIDVNSRFEIAMTKPEKQKFINDITSSAKLAVENMLSTIDLAKSDAFKKEDKERIFASVEATCGFSTLNSIVFERMRNLMIEITKSEIDRDPPSLADESKGSLVFALAELYFTQGEMEVAQKLYEQYYEDCKVRFGEKHRTTILSYNSIGVALELQGYLELAGEYYQKCIDWFTETNGPDCEDAVLISENTAVVYLQLAQNAEMLQNAATILSKCYEYKKEHHGSDSRSSLSTLSNLCAAYRESGELEKSEGMFALCLEKSKIVYGEMHPHTMNVMHNFANLYVSMEQYGKALPLKLACYERRKVIFGEDHHLTISSCAGVGGCYFRLNQLDLALENTKNSADRAISVLGPTHHETLEYISTYAKVYMSLRRFEDALPLLAKCLEGKKQTLGENNPTVFSVLYEIACCHREMGQLSEADELFCDCFSKQKNFLGVENSETSNSAIALALLYKDNEMKGKELLFLESALISFKSKLPPDNAMVLWLSVQLVDAYVNDGQFDSALSIALCSLQAKRASHPDGRASIGVLYKVGNIHQRKKEYKEAAKYFREAWDLLIEFFGVDHSETIDVMNSLIEVHSNLGDEDTIKEIMEINQQQIDKNQRKIAWIESLPKEITVSYHEHILTKYASVYQGQYGCDKCSLSGQGWVYHCDVCGFDVHPHCTEPFV